MDEQIQKELEELQNLPEAERDENQQNRFELLNALAEAEKTATQKSKDLESALAQKEHFRTKHEESEKKLQGLQGKTPPESQTGGGNKFDPMETVKISKILSKYNDEESEFILERAGSVSHEAIKKAEEDKWTQIAIQGMREKVAKENKIPAPGSFSPFGPIQKSPEEIAGMSKEEHRRYEEQLAKERQGQGI